MKKLNEEERKILQKVHLGFLASFLFVAVPIMFWILTGSGVINIFNGIWFLSGFMFNAICAVITRIVIKIFYKYDWQLSFGWIFSVLLAPIASIRYAYNQLQYTLGIKDAYDELKRKNKRPTNKYGSESDYTGENEWIDPTDTIWHLSYYVKK